ncbi:hypothetical protein BJY04DRAFT_185003 [Aspergillus karnatakaensis]|uniref:uncharacterized protein n=1 Tax=Aspergillus karnatakaensis TaxID=1810916 RepID=UPI003CCD7898
MNLLTVLTIVASLAMTTTAVRIGTSCSGSGFACSHDLKYIAVCNGSRWMKSADCTWEKYCHVPRSATAPQCVDKFVLEKEGAEAGAGTGTGTPAKRDGVWKEFEA